jgi:hypothetical protein
MKAFALLLILVVVLICSLLFLGASSVLTGALSGIFVSVTSLLLLSAAVKKFGTGAQGFCWTYFLRSFVVRLVVAGGLLFLFIGVLKINTLGILAGLLMGLVINTVFLTRLNAKR